jgi:hypothetical protein
MTKYEGQYLVFNRRSKRLWFKEQAIDDATHFTVGKVVKGAVAGKPVEYWLERMEGQKRMEART